MFDDSPPLREGEPHLWSARVDDRMPATADELALLDDVERRRATMMKAPLSRERFIRSHVFLRQVLSQYVDAPPEGIVLHTANDGKPYMHQGHPVGYGGLHFSLSHSADAVAVAVAHSSHVGIDLEHKRPLTDAVALARRYFSANESAAFDAAGGSEEQQELFYNIWVRKEAVLKALGVGIRVKLSEVDVMAGGELHQVRVRHGSLNGGVAGVYVRNAALHHGFAAAIASVVPIRSLVVRIPAD